MRLRTILVLAAGSLTIGATTGAVTASAGVVLSDEKYLGCMAGHCYDNRATLEIDPNGHAAAQIVYTNTGNNTPAGYMGVSPRIWHDSGQLCSSSGWSFTAQATDSFVNYDRDFCGNGNYYSQGWTKEWNGSNYTSDESYRTPSQTY